MDFRTWVYTTLTAYEPLTAIVPAGRIYGAGSVDKAPKTPFIVLTFDEKVRVFGDRGPYNLDSTFWAHDRFGSYLRIETILELMKTALLEAPLNVAGIICPRWQGDSRDLTDPGYGTITKNSSYRLVAAS